MGVYIYTRNSIDDKCDCSKINNKLFKQSLLPHECTKKLGFGFYYGCECCYEDVKCNKCNNYDSDTDDEIKSGSPSDNMRMLFNKYKNTDISNTWDYDFKVRDFLRMGSEIENAEDIRMYAIIMKSMVNNYISFDLDNIFSIKYR